MRRQPLQPFPHSRAHLACAEAASETCGQLVEYSRRNGDLELPGPASSRLAPSTHTEEDQVETLQLLRVGAMLRVSGAERFPPLVRPLRGVLTRELHEVGERADHAPPRLR